MTRQSLKLKQASAVLQMQPKELQNLVQFGIVKPRRSEGTYVFDTNALLVAKVASYLKESLATCPDSIRQPERTFSESPVPSMVLFAYFSAKEGRCSRCGVLVSWPFS